MKHAILFILLMVPFVCVKSQVNDTINSKNDNNAAKKAALVKDTGGLYLNIKKKLTVTHEEKQPEYPGGNQALLRYIREEINYPKELRKIKGKAMLKFTVDTLGQVQNVKVIKSLHPTLDKEAVRVIQTLPKWKPGSVDGVSVNVDMALPITF